ncbi:MAG: hypothetical protein K0R50_4844 [Eubacterium sp.]|nr:hypothetical protein [Eubacterium sp.]
MNQYMFCYNCFVKITTFGYYIEISIIDFE